MSYTSACVCVYNILGSGLSRSRIQQSSQTQYFTAFFIPMAVFHSLLLPHSTVKKLPKIWQVDIQSLSLLAGTIKHIPD